MKTRCGIKLAVHLLSSFFGDIVAKVGECLLEKGTLTSRQIIMYTNLDGQSVKNSLLVLIHRNCVQAFALEIEGVSRYMVLFDNIIHHMRFPKFLIMVKEELGEECQDILLALLEHGRLSMSQISDRHNDRPNRNEEVVDPDALLRNFNRLVEARFIERCPEHEALIPAPTDEEIAAEKKRRGAKAAKMQAAEALEVQALRIAGPKDTLRFLVKTFDDSDDCGVDNKENSSSVTAGEKPDSLLRTKKEILWRANFEEFLRCFRHKSCVTNVRTRLDDTAAIVLNAILQASRAKEHILKTEYSDSLSMNDIFDEVIKSEQGRALTLDHVRAALVQLGCNIPEIDIDETFRVDLKNILELAQADEVESIILKRYGRDAYRIFRLLSKAVHVLETDVISDLSFVDKKDTARILFKLWKDDYLHMERVEATVGKANTYLLWKVNKPVVWEHVLDEMYHAALNLRIRKAHELAKDKEILLLPKESRKEGELERRYNRFLKVRTALESSLMNLDDSIMLFNDF